MLRLPGLKAIGMLLVLGATGQAQPKPEIHFEDVTRAAGISWTHSNGATPDKYLIETMGGGAAFLDFDRDGNLDLYLVDSGFHRHSGSEKKPKNGLFRNLGNGTFVDVTARAGVSGEGGGYGNGVAIGDIDNDGFPDIYITTFGRNLLYRNLGDGRFDDITDKAGLAVGLWSTSAAFFDYDRDGDLDLVVCIYLEWDYDKNTWCGERREGFRSYCHPDYFKPIPNRLYRNNGNLTFTDVTAESGFSVPGKGLGVVTGDIDQDGWPDVYIANDAVANFLFRNLKNGKFEESALLSEVAYGVSAKPESGMGTDLGDFNGDGRIDLIVTNIDYEMNNLYLNEGDGFFSDVTVVSGLGQVVVLYSGFGVRFLDVDNDGDLDLVVLNGHPLDNIEIYRNGVTSHEEPMVFENRSGKFERLMNAGELWTRKLQGRALAGGDYDNDGDTDLLFVTNGGPPVLARNDSANDNQWLGILLQGESSNRDAVGATLTLETSKRKLFRERHGGGSYQAAHDPRVVFGLEKDEKPIRLLVRWPSGRAQEIGDLKAGRYASVKEQSP